MCLNLNYIWKIKIRIVAGLFNAESHRLTAAEYSRCSRAGYLRDTRSGQRLDTSNDVHVLLPLFLLPFRIQTFRFTLMFVLSSLLVSPHSACTKLRYGLCLWCLCISGAFTKDVRPRGGLGARQGYGAIARDGVYMRHSRSGGAAVTEKGGWKRSSSLGLGVRRRRKKRKKQLRSRAVHTWNNCS